MCLSSPFLAVEEDAQKTIGATQDCVLSDCRFFAQWLVTLRASLPHVPVDHEIAARGNQESGWSVVCVTAAAYWDEGRTKIIDTTQV